MGFRAGSGTSPVLSGLVWLMLQAGSHRSVICVDEQQALKRFRQVFNESR